MTPEQLDAEWLALRRVGPLDTVMRFGEEGLVLGLGTVLSRAAGSPREVSVDVSDPRLVTLLAAAHLRVAQPASLAHLRKAAERWRQHDDAFASMHLALSGLDRLERPLVDARRLFFADHLLSGGFRADAIVNALGDIAKYSPDQPRVPAGSGRSSGQWTSGGTPSDPQRSDAASQGDQQSSGGRDTSKFKIELPSSFACAPPRGTTAAMSEAAKKMADKIEFDESISKWRELGPKGEALIREAVQAEGWKVLGIHVALRTTLGLRIEDVMVEVPPGAIGNPKTIVGFIEVKVNGGWYSTLQQDKDALIWSEGGTLLRSVGKYKAGKRVKFGTGLANVTITYEP